MELVREGGGKKMKGYKVYSQIKQLQEKGFSKSAVAKQLMINRRTVDRYWVMSTEEYENQDVSRRKLLDGYHQIILDWLETHPTLSSAQICDWLKEHYKASYPERTVSRYVKILRKEYNLPKTVDTRDYEAVPDKPFGEQMQVDFGEKGIFSSTGKRVKVRFVAFVLANSRYKFVDFQSRPYTAVDLARACRECFSYIGGIPRELVFDLDCVVVVSENYGDIIHTYEFEKLRQDLKFSVRLCRAADPASKGKIESVIKFVKNNFLENRIYVDDEILNDCALEWLSRTGNAKIHGTTKKIPAEVFKIEREHLRPLPSEIYTGNNFIYRTVRKDNTIIYDSNRYSVPLGTYENQKEVQINSKDGTLYISTTFGDPICEHVISIGRGMLIKNTNHGRNRDEGLDKLLDSVSRLLENEAHNYLRHLRYDKPRYARDQLKLIETLCNQYGVASTLKAIRVCEELNIISATYVRDYLKNSHPEPTIFPFPAVISSSDLKYHISVEKRPLEAYVKAGGTV